MSTKVLVSIIIKTLDEEARIAACIESALEGLGDLPGEVIVADSGSTDSTVDIALTFPVRVVQLADPSLACCGAGPQLGYQLAQGDYVYILDGDMCLDPFFIERALLALSADPALGGVAGLVEEACAENLQFRGRRDRGAERRAGSCRWLDMGGLYRREAIDSVGHFSNAGFRSCEEQELGLRLGARGWRMRRLSWPAVRHHGHAGSTLALQRRRLRSGYLEGPGQMLRASLGAPWARDALVTHRHLLITLGLWLMLLVGLLALPFTRLPLLAWAAGLGILLTNRIIRYRSLGDALAVLGLWHIDALAMVRGFLRRGRDPSEPLPMRILRDAPSEPVRATSSGRG